MSTQIDLKLSQILPPKYVNNQRGILFSDNVDKIVLRLYHKLQFFLFYRMGKHVKIAYLVNLKPYLLFDMKLVEKGWILNLFLDQMDLFGSHRAFHLKQDESFLSPFSDLYIILTLKEFVRCIFF